MTYQINYTGKNDGRVHCMFDIEYYMDQSDSGKWFSEIRCLPIVEGLTYFLRDRLSEDGFDSERFIKDAGEIQEIRGLLYERYDNRPKEGGDAQHFHYHVFGDALEQILDGFCAEYNLSLNMD